MKDFEGPVQVTELFVNEGITTIVATTGDNPAFVTVNELILPLPVAARPIPGVSFVQE